ncbi:pyridoxine 5'-phosphate synthase [Blochmannia endosymbiont of Colobopsis nipponica]|uniref:pyridoxine 5'-phosphate synthase n=1 Tax=Blochmannia endosymbiont of Colobopsis nipponica TaxID=2681987 RepID=UPI00177DD364|nr:pyridoxine 5'-phosphate synthase [Blochmannia endosymbiont of Colobopsis nipponica]QOI11345.1 pyridoxine 5'-phosphate synthase [Blochmannia endosymbiont of Colobopsis nipponica]
MKPVVRLGVNIDHVATIRQARGVSWPDPIQAAFIAEQSGADSITVHLREDRRHINDRDVYLLRKTIQTFMNLEMSATEEMVNFACQLKPYSCCLVPEKREEITTENGLDVISNKYKLRQALVKLGDSGIKPSLFINSDYEQIAAAIDIGASCIEIHTGVYSRCIDEYERISEFERIKNGVLYASKHGLRVNAGHGLDYHNVGLIASLSFIRELNIGHAIISRSIFCGLSQAVKDMKNLILEAQKK